MIDIETKEPVKVYSEGKAGAYLMIPLVQLSDVRRILEENGIQFDLRPYAIQDEPERPFIASSIF
jgi:hypothetical protein